MVLSRLTLLEKCLVSIKPVPITTPLIRIGGNGDGGYLCPDILHGISGCISPGTNTIKYFEDDLLSSWGIPSIMIDAGSTEENFTTPMQPGQMLIRKWMMPRAGNSSVTLDEVLDNPLMPAGDLLLQMDIEGHEYDNINSWSAGLLGRFKVIVIEFHCLSRLKRPWRPKARKMMSAISRLSETHLCVHLHPNNCCGSFRLAGTNLEIPNVVECTYLRRDCAFVEADARVLLPHPLDSSNLPHLSDLIADDAWCADEDTFLASLKEGRFARISAGIGFEIMALWGRVKRMLSISL